MKKSQNALFCMFCASQNALFGEFCSVKTHYLRVFSVGGAHYLLGCCARGGSRGKKTRDEADDDDGCRGDEDVGRGESAGVVGDG